VKERVAKLHPNHKELSIEPSGTKDTSAPSEQDVGFETAWIRYPPRNGKRLAKAKAQAVWNKLSAADRELVITAVGNYATACEAGLTIAKDAHRWLRDRDFADWQTPARASPNGSEASEHYTDEDEWGVK
jgi:hypothetical protein